MGELQYAQNEWCYKYIHMRIPVLEVGQTGSKFRLAPTPGLTPTGTMLPYRSTLVNLLAKGLSMNSDLGHNEAQFQWLRYQLDSRVKLLAI